MSETDSATGSVVGPVEGVVQSLLAAVEGSFLAKLLVAEGILVATVLGLFAIGGDFTRETPSAFGVLGGFLGAIAGILGLIIVVFAVGLVLARAYYRLSRR